MLDIEAIHANTPQAKGRVERANQTLQDRLVKELRLQGISHIHTANAFLPGFIEAYHASFAVEPQNPTDAHRTVLHSQDELALILTLQHTRKLSKNLICQFQNRQYQVQPTESGYTLRGAAITVCEAFDGTVTLLHKGRKLAYRLLAEGEAPTPLADEKNVQAIVEQAKVRQARKPHWKTAADHPWRSSPIGSAAS